ncbi:hypothetical protein [Phenylobacterium sp.]|uniref:hypothetical protein n=1 Tax=Phenylobacterium sp. TaxID=1871053 RepID=UPI00286BD886|nr:hypothetical protein [Phenylobacterium sp.]
MPGPTLHPRLRRSLIRAGLVLVSLVPGLAFSAQAEGVAAAFGNTVATTYPDGRTQEIWLEPGGTWTGIGRTHKPFSGAWTQKGEKICLRQQRPTSFPFSYCPAFPASAHVGDGWASKDFFGTPIQVKLLAGHVNAQPTN